MSSGNEAGIFRVWNESSQRVQFHFESHWIAQSKQTHNSQSTVCLLCCRIYFHNIYCWFMLFTHYNLLYVIMIVEKFRSCLLFSFGSALLWDLETQENLSPKINFCCWCVFCRRGGRKPKRFIDFSQNEFRRIKLLFVKRFVRGCSTVTQLMLSEKSSTCVEQIKIHFESFLLNLIAIRNRAKEQNTLKPQPIGNWKYLRESNATRKTWTINFINLEIAKIQFISLRSSRMFARSNIAHFDVHTLLVCYLFWNST